MLIVHFQLLWNNENNLLEDTADQGQKGINSAKGQMVLAGTSVPEPCGSTAALQTAGIHIRVPVRACVVGHGICWGEEGGNEVGAMLEKCCLQFPLSNRREKRISSRVILMSHSVRWPYADSQPKIQCYLLMHALCSSHSWNLLSYDIHRPILKIVSGEPQVFVCSTPARTRAWKHVILRVLVMFPLPLLWEPHPQSCTLVVAVGKGSFTFSQLGTVKREVPSAVL